MKTRPWISALLVLPAAAFRRSGCVSSFDPFAAAYRVRMLTLLRTANPAEW